MSIKRINAISGFRLWLVIALFMVTAGALSLITHSTQVLMFGSDIDKVLSSPWTIITYMWIHADVWHLLVNLIWLGVFIYAASGVLSNMAIIIIFITGGVCGASAYMIYSHTCAIHQGALVGASAAILAIAAAIPAASPHAKIKIPFTDRCLNICILVIPVIAIFGLLSVSDSPGSLAAHAGGLTAGAAAGAIYARMMMSKSVDDYSHISQEEKLRLLDKVRRSGYASLTSGERLLLSRMSKN
ncbi:MAG: rhomboid family intramembrane serine protease [Paramuribaculum sp.]|nr:rhomboid family intramembrane serine protease [Paramuribaculum sp.]